MRARRNLERRLGVCAGKVRCRLHANIHLVRVLEAHSAAGLLQIEEVSNPEARKHL